MPISLFLRCVLLCCLFLPACASTKAGMDAPQLPAKHWLEEAPGVPVTNKEKLEAAVPELYGPDKVYSFDDCVFLAIQQSPMLVKSAIELEMSQLKLTDAVWQFLPQPRMTLTTSANLTRYNQDTKDTYDNYGQTQFRVGFYAQLPNPVYTYFNQQVQRISVGLAISAHRKAIGEAILKIADIYLKLNAKKRINALQEGLPMLAKQTTAYWKQVESIEGKQGIEHEMAVQQERQTALSREKAGMEENILRTELKILAGVNPQYKLNLDAADAKHIVADFDAGKINWEDRWKKTEDELIVRTQVKLADYDIMLSWAKYMPDVSMSINNNPPMGQYQPPTGAEDTFFHLTIDFPLLDWGSRYRGVQLSRMAKAQAFHAQANKRDDYSNKWLQNEQATTLAATEFKIAANSLQISELKYKQAEIGYKEGSLELPDLMTANENLVHSRIKHIQAGLELDLAKIKWMHLAGLLQERYLGLPALEVK